MERFVLFMWFFLIGLVVALVDSTLVNLNKGSQVSLFVNDINYRVEATVQSCEEYGPVDIRTGFGYWTHCEVEYRDQYLVSTKATVTRSIVTADEINTTVDLWVTCNHLHEKCAVGNEPSQLVTFLAILPQLEGHRLDEWITAVEADDLPTMASFAFHLRRDFDAIQNGLTLPYNSGPVEGHVNRLKMLKRQMFGRANLDLLRKRVLMTP